MGGAPRTHRLAPVVGGRLPRPHRKDAAVTAPQLPAPPLRRILAHAGYELRVTLRNGEQLLLSLILPAMILVFLSTSTDRKSTRLNSSHVATSYAVSCLTKKTQNRIRE